MFGGKGVYFRGRPSSAADTFAPTVMNLRLTILAAVLSLIAWVLLAFVFPVGVGAVHLLLAIGTTLLVRWYALKYA